MLKIIYAGTPEFAVPALEALIQSDHQVVAVYTQPDRPAGRGRKLQFSPVKDCAMQQGLTIEQPENFKNQSDVEHYQAFSADLMVVAAYGILLPATILQSPSLGCVNIHASLLPRCRGAAPIQRAILAGDQQTGITLMQMDVGLDTGDMLAKSTLRINQNSTSADLHDDLKMMGAELLMDNLQAIEKTSIKGEKQQDSDACYAAKLTKKEASIDWSKAAEDIHREVRAFNPWPVSFTGLKGQNIKVWATELSDQLCAEPPGKVIAHTKQGVQVSCGGGVLSISELQFAGKKRATAEQILNSRNLTDEIFCSL